MNKAILIPANPDRVFRHGMQEGSIAAHEIRIELEGAVFWRLVAPGQYIATEFLHSDIKNGYLYDTAEK